MKNKSTKHISTLLAIALAFCLLSAMPLTAGAVDGPIEVTLNPVGVNYVLNHTAVPLKATFYYSGGTEQPYANYPIKVQWYWSLTDSNTGRDNGQGEYVRDNWLTMPFEYQTTLTPTTNTVGVRYYYAVLEYMVYPHTLTHVAEPELRYAVTEPARIEVYAPDQPAEQSFQVKKVDESGNPLAGAVLSLVPDTAHTWGEKKSYEATSRSDGYATFTVTEGAYILSEEKAPTGYNATDETHIIWVDAEQVMEVVEYRTQNYKPYETLTYVNKKIPTLNPDDHFAYMQGYPEGTFLPAKYMTRAEAVVMFSRLLVEGMNPTGNYKIYATIYPDISPTAWFINEVGYMENLGVLAHYSRDGKFRPNESVTRAEFATLATHFDNITLTDTNAFTDVPSDHWAVKFINSAAAKGWILGDPIGTFRPEANITRAEVVTLVNRMLKRTADLAYIAANKSLLPRVYSDINTDQWWYEAVMEASTGHDYIKDSSGEHWSKVYE